MLVTPIQTHMQQAKGFTLIEGLAAIAILTSAIIAPMSIAQQGLRATFIARDQIIAFYLAQEAVEYLRVSRDSNKLSGGDWADWLDEISDCQSPDHCLIDLFKQSGQYWPSSESNQRIDVCGGSPCNLIYDTALGLYGYNFAGTNSVATRFVRDVIVTPLASGNEVQVTVTVSWQAAVGARSVVINEFLKDLY